MKKKILISVGILVVIGLIIIGIIIIGRSNNTQTQRFSNTEPMYGAASYGDYVTNRGARIEEVDNSFVKDVTNGGKATKDAFRDAISLAWNYLEKKDPDTAMKRCNQSWLLDQSNFNTYWCYGVVLSYKKDLERSALYFDKAITMYSAAQAINENDYLALYRGAAVVFINLSDRYVSTDSAQAQKYATKAISLLSTSLKDKKLAEKMIPIETLLLAGAYYNNGSYLDSRNTYNALVKKYPEFMTEPNAVKLDNFLKNEGY